MFAWTASGAHCCGSATGRRRDPGAALVVEPGEPLLVRFPARAGHACGERVVHETDGGDRGMAPSRLPIWTFSFGRGYVQRMALESMEIEGPFSPDTLGPGPGGEGEAASRRRIFVCRPETAAEEEPCADEILGALARRAFRRPVDELDLEVLRGFYAEGRAEGNFDAGIQRALESMLVDPEFLFRIERDPAGVDPATPYPLSDVELASRLSFFLWSSIPDEELLDAAAAGHLTDPEVLEQQVRRLLADEKAGVLVSSFAAQWLHLRRMRTVTPDVNAFPGFDDNLRDALVRETELFVRNQIRDDRSVVDLLDATIPSSTSGSPATTDSERVRLPLPPRGVAGRGAPRSARPRQRPDGDVAGYAHIAGRAGQVGAGEHLGTPPPPPPPDVPDLPERADDGTVTSCARGWRRTAPTRCARTATPGWIRSASPWRTSTRSASGATPALPARASILPAPCPTGPPSTAFPACGTYCWSVARSSSRPSPRSC